MHYWSRSRGTLWKKGETSGHLQIVKEIRAHTGIAQIAQGELEYPSNAALDIYSLAPATTPPCSG